MLAEKTTTASEGGEDARRLLQTRLAGFWKAICFLMLFATVLGALGPMARPGIDVFVDLACALEAGVVWWLCRRGKPSVRFLRVVELVALLVFFSAGAFVGRFVLTGFSREHALVTVEGTLMADAYLSVLGLFGSALMLLVRAALIPSSPRRTLVYAVLVAVPVLFAPTAFAPSAPGGLALRTLSSGIFPWLPASLAVVWSFVAITSTVVSRAIYGLQREVREARRLGQYVLEEKIGEGGMGEVYRARHGLMRRPSALKLMRSGHGQAREADIARFEREVQLTARLTHPNTITIFDYGRTDDGVFYYAMELLDGANLQRLVELTGAQPEGRVVRVLMMACGALAEAHAIGLIHRDIKPANIMLCTQGGERDVVKLLDFGLVKELTADGPGNASGVSALTGTPQYMSPEAIVAPDSVDARTDIYALGAVAYFLLAGAELFDGKSIVELCGQHVHQAPEPLSARGVTVSPALEAIVLACLEKKPDARPQTAAELRRRLEGCGVSPWDAESARAFWLANEARLAPTGEPVAAGNAVTLRVGGGARFSPSDDAIR